MKAGVAGSWQLKTDALTIGLQVRCDAVAEDGTITTCQQCKKAHLTCEYSRIPMKRGPSKG